MGTTAAHPDQGDLLAQMAELSDDAVRRIVSQHTDADKNLAFQFERFHRAHPEVYKVLVHLARTATSNGIKRLGIAMLWERLRWEFTVGEQSGADYKLNNNWRSFYARLIMEQEADLAGIFETRRGTWQRDDD